MEAFVSKTFRSKHGCWNVILQFLQYICEWVTYGITLKNNKTFAYIRLCPQSSAALVSHSEYNLLATSQAVTHLFMAQNGLQCADVLLRNHSFSHFNTVNKLSETFLMSTFRSLICGLHQDWLPVSESVSNLSQTWFISVHVSALCNLYCLSYESPSLDSWSITSTLSQSTTGFWLLLYLLVMLVALVFSALVTALQFFLQFCVTCDCLQCFDAVGWAAGRASGL